MGGENAKQKYKCIFDSSECEFKQNEDETLNKAFGRRSADKIGLWYCQRKACRKNRLGFPSLWLTKYHQCVLATTAIEAEDELKEQVVLVGEYANKRGCFNCDLFWQSGCAESKSALQCCKNWFPSMPRTLPAQMAEEIFKKKNQSLKEEIE